MVVAELTKDQKVLLTSALQLIKESETGVKSSVVEKLEKELKNVMAESGTRFIVDDEFQQSEDTEQLPDNW